jgi:hypothetical protein
MRRLLPLLLVCVFASAAMAQSADLRVSLTMPATKFFYDRYTPVRVIFGTLTITNAGNVPSQDVTLDFAGGVYPSSPFPFQGTKCSGTPRPTRCTVPSIVPGTFSLLVYGEWYPTAGGTIETTSVTASSASTPDPDLTNNTGVASTLIIAQYNLTFDPLGVPSTVAVGKTAAITASYSNHGPTPAEDMAITISVPPGARYEGYYAPSYWYCAEPPLGGEGDLVCTSHLIGGETNDSVEALVGVDPSLAPGTILTLHGTLTSASALPSPLTASGNLTVTAPTSSDPAVSVTATVDQPSIVVNGWTTATYTISNAGPHDADIVTLDVRPPDGSLLASAKTTLGSCSGTDTLHCVAATLPAGATMTLTIAVHSFTAGTFTSTAVVTWLNGGPIAASSSFDAMWVSPSRHRAVPH